MNRLTTLRVGLDIGSTTLKCIILDADDQVVFRSYMRHGAQIIAQVESLLSEISDFVRHKPVLLCVSGSAGMGIAQACNLPFLQEVYATRVALQRLLPDTDVAIELGGEDAKILFLTNGLDVRMNGSCAGGTGAFIDQMATLLDISVDELNEQAKSSQDQYAIASRCGVFAKSDIQPLLNQGARKSDIAASIFSAVVNQTIGGLAQGRPIRGNIVYLGGPLYFLSELRTSFDTALALKGSCPEDALYYVALGTAFTADTVCDIELALRRVREYQKNKDYLYMPPLFENKEAYALFRTRHAQDTPPGGDLSTYTGKVYLGVDSGSTTLKLALIGEKGELLYTSYGQNSGNPVPQVKDTLCALHEQFPHLNIVGGASTGYGEELIKNAFDLSHSVVETVAHSLASQHFMPDVEFIIDIGGQDMKCLHMKNGVIDNIFLNEACSSGCGSFLQSFASALGYSIEDFARLGLFADRPVDLGSRCTVFMNSSVKQAQKDGASIENISAGLSISVVKNALYKVIRPASKDALGKRIVVQGGTFLNDAVLRAFEQELDIEVIRPSIAGLMGAYGAALYALQARAAGILSYQALRTFEHTVQDARCGLCSNNCRLTVNKFSFGRTFISGNRCERPLTKKKHDAKLDLYEFKLSALYAYEGQAGRRGKIGIPMGLNLYELLPFWHAFFSALDFEIVLSPPSDQALYIKGQSSMPSDTVCFPAKLMHGHIQHLLDEGVDTIFYPCLSYNIDEGLGDKHYNCPIIAYYPEVIGANVPGIERIRYISQYVGIHNKRAFPKKFYPVLKKHWPDIQPSQVRHAAAAAYEAYDAYMNHVHEEGLAIIRRARQQQKPIIVLAGRPYHVDPEVNHGINRLITGLGAAVISEDALIRQLKKHPVQVLNQWTYHARLYAAAHYIANQPDMHLVQLVSFGCGLDAVTTDEVRSILESYGKLYTQLKIDEITNLGAIKIRLRSLMAVLQTAAAGREQEKISGLIS
ncbi:MAG: acyl-CoA dehydratase activase-related protein [Christensenellales bacterium]|jgi:predicted CoA-substrate-specific enzyme activase